jgi:hypothetical protein
VPAGPKQLRALLAAATLIAGAFALAAPAAGAATETSSNWAGWVAHGKGSSTQRFTSVSGTWTQPSATCSAGRATYSAAWVGLGGYATGAKSLEQIGTEADCSRSGTPSYLAWVELLPAAPSSVSVKVHPGDRLSASVTVIGGDATLRLRNLSTGASYSRTRRLSSKDVRSAEWIVEAPSECSAGGACQTLPLTDFGGVAFSSATATAAGRTGAVADSRWTATRMLLRQGAVRSEAAASGPAQRALVTATPSVATGAGGSFSVAYAETTSALGAPSAPTLPGFSGGSPP